MEPNEAAALALKIAAGVGAVPLHPSLHSRLHSRLQLPLAHCIMGMVCVWGVGGVGGAQSDPAH
jgi:hypothetical protein